MISQSSEALRMLSSVASRVRKDLVPEDQKKFAQEGPRGAWSPAPRLVVGEAKNQTVEGLELTPGVRVELDDDLEPGVAFWGLFVCLLAFPGHTLLSHYCFTVILQHDAGCFTFLIPCIWDSFFLVEMSLNSSMPLSFWFGLVSYCSRQCAINNINMVWTGEVASRCCCPLGTRVFNSQTKN